MVKLKKYKVKHEDVEKLRKSLDVIGRNPLAVFHVDKLCGEYDIIASKNLGMRGMMDIWEINYEEQKDGK